MPCGSGWHFSLGRGSLTILSADAFQAVLPGVDIPDMPFIGAYSLRSENLSATKAVLNGNGIQTQEIASDTLRVDPLPALGSTMIFTQGAAKAPWMED